MTRRLSAVLIGGIAAVVFGQIASAADLPRKAPAYVPPPVPVYNWTGFYVGGNVGYSWGKASGDVSDPNLANFPSTDLVSLPTSFSNSLKPKGAIAGGQIGYNWQLNPTWVVGLEGDIQWSGEKASRSQSASDSGSQFICPIATLAVEICRTLTESVNVNTTLEAKIRWFSTLRARAGVLITPTLLLYGTGGFAFGDVNVSGSINTNDTVSCTGFPCGGLNFIQSESLSFSRSKTKTGWTLGAGVEGAIAGNWTWKAEYLYLDLGSDSGSVSDNFGGTVSWNSKFTDNIVRAGLNYRFGGPY